MSTVSHVSTIKAPAASQSIDDHKAVNVAISRSDSNSGTEHGKVGTIPIARHRKRTLHMLQGILTDKMTKKARWRKVSDLLQTTVTKKAKLNGLHGLLTFHVNIQCARSS